MITREVWGSKVTKRPPYSKMLNVLYIHHTAGHYPVGYAEEVQQMHILQDRAINVLGHSDIEYNLLVTPSGRVYEGRGTKYMSAATLDQNAISRTIAVMGNYQNDTVTDQAMNGIREAIGLMVTDKVLTQDCLILGHRDNPLHLNATVCPGNSLYKRLSELEEPMDYCLTNEEPRPFQGTSYPVGAIKYFLTNETGIARRMPPEEWDIRGNPPGTPKSNKILDALGAPK